MLHKTTVSWQTLMKISPKIRLQIWAFITDIINIRADIRVKTKKETNKNTYVQCQGRVWNSATEQWHPGVIPLCDKISILFRKLLSNIRIPCRVNRKPNIYYYWPNLAEVLHFISRLQAVNSFSAGGGYQVNQVTWLCLPTTFLTEQSLSIVHSWDGELKAVQNDLILSFFLIPRLLFGLETLIL